MMWQNLHVVQLSHDVVMPHLNYSADILFVTHSTILTSEKFNTAKIFTSLFFVFVVIVSPTA